MDGGLRGWNGICQIWYEYLGLISKITIILQCNAFHLVVICFARNVWSENIRNYLMFFFQLTARLPKISEKSSMDCAITSSANSSIFLFYSHGTKQQFLFLQLKKMVILIRLAEFIVKESIIRVRNGVHRAIYI